MYGRNLGFQWLALPVIALLAIGFGVHPASADDILILDQAQTKNLQFSETDGGFTSSLTVSNTGLADLGLSLAGTGDLDMCDFTLEPSNVAAKRTAVVKIQVDDCTIPESGGRVTLSTSDAAAQSPVTLEVATKKSLKSDLTWILLVFLVAALFTLIPIWRVWTGRPTKGGPTNESSEPEQPVLCTDELPATDPKFSFSESWATSISAGATIFVALVGADVLTVVFGEEPKELIGQILVAGVIAGLCIGLAPLALKAVGRTEAVTVRGLLLGGYLTLTGVSGQIPAVGWAVRRADRMGEMAGWGVLAVAMLFALFLWFYGYRTLTVQLKASFKAASPAPIPVELIAAVAASHPDWSAAQVLERAKELVLERAKELADEKPAVTGYPSITSYSVLRTSPGDDLLPRRSGVL